MTGNDSIDALETASRINWLFNSVQIPSELVKEIIKSFIKKEKRHKIAAHTQCYNCESQREKQSAKINATTDSKRNIS